MKTLVKISALLAFVIMAYPAFAQQTKKQAQEVAKQSALKSKIESGNYTFKATYALPMRGGQRYLTSDYDLRIKKDSVIAFLPYFGQVHLSPPMSPEENGIMFTSTKFSYTVAPMKKGGWTITITPANVKYINKMVLDVFTNGTASLLVTSNYRDQITFNGNIKE